MNKKYLSLGIVTALVVVSGLGSTALAQDNTTTKPAKSDLTERAKENKEKRCEAVTSKVTERVEKFDNNRQDNVIKHKRMVDGVKKIVEKLKEKGYDVTKLEADLKELDSKIVTAAKDFEVFITLLRESKSFACGESQGQFTAKMAEAKKQLAVVKQDRMAIREYFVNTIKPDIKAVREQKPAKTGIEGQ